MIVASFEISAGAALSAVLINCSFDIFPIGLLLISAIETAATLTDKTIINTKPTMPIRIGCIWRLLCD
jgi:hypothetical protein